MNQQKNSYLCGINTIKHLSMKKTLLFAMTMLLFATLQAQNPGDLDPLFGTNGTYVTDFTDNPDSPTATFILSDGKILTVGNTWIDYSSYVFLTRHNTNGSLDMTYGSGGKLFFKAIQGGNNYAWDATLLDDESVILAGHAFANNRSNLILAKVNSNGSLDTSFGNNGIAPFSDSRNFVIKACAVQQDGKIVLGGYCEDAFCALRFNANGSLDTSFGSNGIVTDELGLNDSFVECMTLQDDGKIILAGWGIQSHTYNFYESIVARLDENGQFDTSFGTNGYIVFDVHDDLDSAHDVEVLADGKIMINGYYHIYQENCLRYAIYLNRRNADGSVDTSFGTNGFVTNECVSYAENYSEEMLISEDGTIFCTGNSRGSDGSQKLLVSSFTADGMVNQAFGSNGYVLFNFPGHQSESRSLAMQPDGMLVVTGSVFDNDGSNLMLARLYSGTATAISENDWVMLESYPNPCTDQVRFNLSDCPMASVYDMSGRLVMQSRLSADGSLSVTSLSKGSYLVDLQSEGQHFFAKIVK